MSKLASVVLLILFISGFILMAIPSAAGQTNPPTSGDWIIKDRVTQEHKMIILRGDLIIENGGDLRLRNVDLRINCDEDFDYKIKVETGGRLEVFDSSITSQSYHPYMIVVESGGEFAIHNSNVTRYCTTKTIIDDEPGSAFLVIIMAITIMIVIIFVLLGFISARRYSQEKARHQELVDKIGVVQKTVYANDFMGTVKVDSGIYNAKGDSTIKVG
jgi:hypothetical protein